MKQSSQTLSQLVKEACQHPPGSKQRQKNLTQIIRIVNSCLWQENTSYYEDALQETWIYFCRNLCEGKPGKAYDPKRANLITWLNTYLKWRLKDGYIAISKQKQHNVSGLVDSDNRVIDPVANLPAKADIPPILEEIEQWALKDTQNKLSRIYLENHPHITAKVLILRRLPPETAWAKLAQEYAIPAGTLSSFYQRKCKPLLRDFSKSQGYI